VKLSIEKIYKLKFEFKDMEVKYEVVKPNLYVRRDCIYFSLDGSEVVSVSRDIDDIVSRHIENLRVKQSDLEVVRTGKGNPTRRYEVPLSEFLDAVESNHYKEGRITDNTAMLFDLGYMVDAETFEDYEDIRTWIGLQGDIAEPDKLFDRLEENSQILKVDRERTLESMNKLYQELDQKMPRNYADFHIINGFVQHRLGFYDKKVGRIFLKQVKTEDRTKVEDCKSQLVERLKEVEGPCLSLDVPGIINQTASLSNHAPYLVRDYGDVLVNPGEWRKRLFKFDP